MSMIINSNECRYDTIRKVSYLKREAYLSIGFYHVECFEKLADFSQSDYLNRIVPMDRSTAKLRESKSGGILSGHYLVDGGAERLILEWKVSLGKLIDRRDRVPIEPMDTDLDDLLRKSSSAGYEPKEIPGMTDFEFHNLSHRLAPIESHGDEGTQERSLFQEYLVLDLEDLENLHVPDSLSNMLHKWKLHCVSHLASYLPDSKLRSICQLVATRYDDRLSQEGKKLKEELGKKAIRAIQRLASIPMPDFQAAFLGRY